MVGADDGSQTYKFERPVSWHSGHGRKYQVCAVCCCGEVWLECGLDAPLNNACGDICSDLLCGMLCGYWGAQHGVCSMVCLQGEGVIEGKVVQYEVDGPWELPAHFPRYHTPTSMCPPPPKRVQGGEDS